jgi:dimethylglycine dehydrogenase
MDDAAALYSRLWSAGGDLGLSDVGIYAVDCLRLEKCYRSWKQDLTTEFSAFAAGLDRFVRLDKPDFPGRTALIRERERGVTNRLVPLLVDASEADAPATATVFDGDERVGIVTSGGYGHRLGRSIALVYIRSALAVPGRRLAIEIYGHRRAAVVGTEPLYDPKSARMRA